MRNLHNRVCIFILFSLSLLSSDEKGKEDIPDVFLGCARLRTLCGGRYSYSLPLSLRYHLYTPISSVAYFPLTYIRRGGLTICYSLVYIHTPCFECKVLQQTLSNAQESRAAHWRLLRHPALEKPQNGPTDFLFVVSHVPKRTYYCLAPPNNFPRRRRNYAEDCWQYYNSSATHLSKKRIQERCTYRRNLTSAGLRMGGLLLFCSSPHVAVSCDVYNKLTMTNG
jgi:hypothetical protein